MNFTKSEIEGSDQYQNYKNVSNEAKDQRTEFLRSYSPSQLKRLSGIDLLRTMFYNDIDQENMCSDLGSKSKTGGWVNVSQGTQFKYRLSERIDGKASKHWLSGTDKKPIELTQEKAIELGTEIRDQLIQVCDYIESQSTTDPSKIDYKELYRLFDSNFGGQAMMPYLKYLCMNYPSIIPCFFTKKYSFAHGCCISR